MKIVAVNAFLKDLALSKPYTIAWETISKVENVFFEVILENGITGIGAANPAPEVVGEGPADALHKLQTIYRDTLVGKDIRYFHQYIAQARQQFPDSPGTQACIDIALHDAFGQWLGIPVADYYGRFHERLPLSVTIGIKDEAGTLAEAAAYRNAGYHVLKVKTGLDVSADVQRLKSIRKSFGDYFTIRVDANMGYSLKDLEYFLSATKTCGLELIEQPLPVKEDQQLDALPAATRKLLAADESLKNASSALSLAQNNRYGIFNIKLMKCGGITGALAIAGIAAPAGIDLFWGCNDESIVSISAALHAAFSCAHTRYLDLDGSLDLAEDLVSGGFVIENGYMRTTGAPGLGFKKM